VDQVRTVGDQVVVVGGCAGRGKASGVVTDSPLAWVVTVRDGKITSHRGFRTADETLEAAGLSE
jgi:ketosteroid isomerase-like protein